MSELVRFGVSIDEKLLERFDRQIHEKNYKNRSEAIRDLIRDSLVQEDWERDKIIAGGIVLVYNHHQSSAVCKLMDIKHTFHKEVISTQHIHLNHNNCLEIVAVKGESHKVREFFNHLKSTKGLKHISIVKSTTGEGLA